MPRHYVTTSQAVHSPDLNDERVNNFDCTGPNCPMCDAGAKPMVNVPVVDKSDGKIKVLVLPATTFHTITGRISSHEPNFYDGHDIIFSKSTRESETITHHRIEDVKGNVITYKGSPFKTEFKPRRRRPWSFVNDVLAQFLRRFKR